MLLSQRGRRRNGRWCWVRYVAFDTSESQLEISQLEIPELESPELESPEPEPPEHGIPQVGYAIGRNIGNAVLRNRIRRRLRPIVAAEAPHLAPGIYLIGVKNDQAATTSYDELHDDLRQTLQHAASSVAR